MNNEDKKKKKKESNRIRSLIKDYGIKGSAKKDIWIIWNKQGIDEVENFALNYYENNKVITPQKPLDFVIFGKDIIEENTIEQMRTATTLPVAVAGALMPDAHLGYGLPIGGVLATDNAVIPYAVGVDIACRMKLSVFDTPFESKKEVEKYIDKNKKHLSRVLMENTYFGAGYPNRIEHPDHDVLYDSRWDINNDFKMLREKAAQQIGTSGGGNHFVEWVIVDWFTNEEDDLLPNYYIGLLSHSGSRGVGFAIANYYSDLARRIHYNLPKELEHLAWLDMDSEEGQEYWEAMQLAGRYAEANHDIIHNSVAKASGLNIYYGVENHHNFAWKETCLVNGEHKELIVHRKGATRAHKGLYGIIPSSMTSAGMVVSGLGYESSLNSASHGAGRLMSRNKARETITVHQRDALLKDRGVTLLGGGLDEAPQAYKNVTDVFSAQEMLVKNLAWISPKIVRMADD